MAVPRTWELTRSVERFLRVLGVLRGEVNSPPW